jgi:SAM-dependent methyltransferase
MDEEHLPGTGVIQPVEGAATWDEERVEQWVASSDWYQRIPVRDGLVTPGGYDSIARLSKLHLPPLEGKTVLDVGCNSGMYSFECERLGAQRVVGIDVNRKRLRQAVTLKEILRSRVEFRNMSLYDAPSLGTLDYVLCIAVLHDADDLLRALAIIKDAARLAIYLEIHLWKPPLSRRFPLARLVRTKRGWNFLPTRALLEQVVSDSFDVEFLGPSPVHYDLFRLVRKSPIAT